jgi:phosphoribosylglycinamide formyltransferase 2
VWFSEVSPRPHDTGLVTLCSQHFSEFELHARAILGLPVDTRLREPGASAVIYGGLDAKGIAFEGIADALAVPRSDLRLFGKPEAFSKRRMGVAVANGDDVEARGRAQNWRRAGSGRWPGSCHRRPGVPAGDGDQSAGSSSCCCAVRCCLSRRRWFLSSLFRKK